MMTFPNGTATFPPFRVLVVDDEPEVHEAARRELEDVPHIDLVFASTIDQATAALDAMPFHFAFVDLEIGTNANGGFEVLKTIQRVSPTCNRLLLTRYLERHASDLLVATAPTPSYFLDRVGRLTDGTIFKHLADEWFRPFVEPLARAWAESAFTVLGIESIVEALESKRSRHPDLRLTASGISDEVYMLFRSLFAEASVITTNSTITQLTVQPFSGGYSSAVVVSAFPAIGKSHDGVDVLGNHCVVKIGRRDDIEGEVRRYRQAVRYGVALRHRVELLEHALGDSLGAICYSFAGGASAEMSLLDDLIASRRTSSIGDLLDLLFAADSRAWYATPSAPVPLRRYFQANYRVTLADSISRLAEWANRFNGLPRTREFVAYHAQERLLSCGDTTLEIPGAELLGDPIYVRPQPSCLLHGDLHGGNVFISAEGSPCLIDYANVGPGPRTIDFAMLLCALRLHDTPSDGRGGESDEEIDEEIDVDALMACAKSIEFERSWVRSVLAESPGSQRPAPPETWWAPISTQLIDLARANFADLETTEILATLVLTSVRLLGIARLASTRRVRLLAFLNAVLEYQREIIGPLTG